MRRLRWLLPLAIIGILGTVGAVYLKQREILAKGSPTPPQLLESHLQGQAVNWCYEQAKGDKSRVEICASKMNSAGDKMELLGLQLKLYSEDGKKYDLVNSDLAQFDQTQKKLYSEGKVEITLAVPVENAEVPPEDPGRLLKIHTSGVEFSTETGEANTAQAVSFEFNRGGGSSVGGHYDPTTRVLRLDSEVALDWRGDSPETLPIHILSGQAWYYENESRVLLYPWAKLTRESLHMESATSEILLKEGDIERADVQEGRGTQESNGRKVDFNGDELHLHFDEHTTVDSIQAQRNARLVSTTTTSRTTTTADRLDMTFTPVNKESVLTNAVATGKSTVTAEQLPRPGTTPAETRVLNSDVIRLAMRAGGEEIDRVETDGAATLDFLPNSPQQLKRHMNGDRIWINYGKENRIQQFRSINVSTRTELVNALRLTSSKEIVAYFDADGSMTRLEQSENFRYQEGDRRASARKGIFDQTNDLVTLDGSATSSDPTGKVDADRITLNQKSGDFTAEGNVATTRQPSQKGEASAMLSTDEIMQATAKKMIATDNQQRIHYEGNARAWQGANAVSGDRIDIDQKSSHMEAHGKVLTQFADKNTKTGPALFTVVHAQDLDYSSDGRIANYKGGVRLERPNLVVDSQALRAHLKDSSSDSSLEKAFADGAVKIESTINNGKTKRKRTGNGEHGEYYVDEQKVILKGTPCATMVDTVSGRTSGPQLTYGVNNDSLRVDGDPSCKVQTVLPKK
jgi:lipopolysaccharide export system protein LptA